MFSNGGARAEETGHPTLALGLHGDMCYFHMCSHTHTPTPTHPHAALLPPCHRLAIINSVRPLWEMLPLDLGVDGALFAGASSSPVGLRVNLLFLNPVVTSRAVGLLCSSVSSAGTFWFFMVCEVLC